MKIKKISHENNFAYLFFALIIFLFSSALMAQFHTEASNELYAVTTILMFLVSMKSLNIEKTWKRLIYVFVVFFIFFLIAGSFFDSEYYIYLHLLVLLIFFSAVFISAYKQVLFIGEIDLNKIIGSLALYLLLGMIWTVIYLLILVMDHTAFSGVTAGHWQENFAHLAYYSFVTLTTLGYGDILPTNRMAEFFVFLEAIIGVFYMAIIVASLINSHDPKHKGNS